MGLFTNIKKAVGKEIKKSVKKTLLKHSPADQKKYQNKISTTRTIRKKPTKLKTTARKSTTRKTIK